jgi:hypothetical protein
MKLNTGSIGRSLLAAALFSAALFAQDAKTSNEPKPDTRPRRLESVTWNSVDHKLTWVISTGEKKKGEPYKALQSESYDIDMDAAIMKFHGENRRFSSQEAESVHALMDLIAKYAVESTIWWDDGQGKKIDGDNQPEPVHKPTPKMVPEKKPNRNLVIAHNRTR